MIALALCACLFVVNVSAARKINSGKCGKNVTWTVYDNWELVISGKGDMADWQYSADAPWYNYRGSLKKITVLDGVTSIAPCAFYCQEVAVSVSIADSVTKIGENAFINCRALTQVDIGDGVREIGAGAFSGCENLAGVRLPDSLVTIGENAFHGCDSLTEIIIPDSVTTVGQSAFADCARLTSVMIGAGVTDIGDRAFAAGGSLTEISVRDNANYSAADGVLFDKEKTVLIRYPAGKSGTYTVPDGVTEIEDWAFAYSTLTDVTIPQSVTSIGNSVFYDCRSLTGITIGDGVTNIGDFAFYQCESLTDVTVPGSVTEIGDCAFYNCDLLTNVQILTKTTSFGTNVFGSTVAVSAYRDSTAEAYAEDNANAFTPLKNPAAGTGIAIAGGVAVLVCGIFVGKKLLAKR